MVSRHGMMMEFTQFSQQIVGRHLAKTGKGRKEKDADENLDWYVDGNGL